MQAQNIIAFARNILDDAVAPYLWEDTELLAYLNEAQIEAFRRGRLAVVSDPAFNETVASSTITLNSGVVGGSITQLTVNNCNIITGSISFTTDINTTANLLSNNINTTGKFTSTVANNVITLQPLAGNGAGYNNISSILTTTNITSTITSFAGGIDGMCRITTYPNQNKYYYDKRILKIREFRKNSNGMRLVVKDYRWFFNMKDWNRRQGIMNTVVKGLETRGFTIYKIADHVDAINMSIVRAPLNNIVNLTDELENIITDNDQLKLAYYVLFRCFQKNDSEVDSTNKSQKYYQMFEAQFGEDDYANPSLDQYNQITETYPWDGAY